MQSTLLFLHWDLSFDNTNSAIGNCMKLAQYPTAAINGFYSHYKKRSFFSNKTGLVVV